MHSSKVQHSGGFWRPFGRAAAALISLSALPHVQKLRCSSAAFLSLDGGRITGNGIVSGASFQVGPARFAAFLDVGSSRLHPFAIL